MYTLIVVSFLGLLVQTTIPALASDSKANQPPAKYKLLGCYIDKNDRAIASLEGTNPILDGHYRSRENKIEKCYKVSLSLGYKVFAIQDDGQCFGSATAEKTYKKYGESTGCSTGKGGAMANSVYEIAEVCGYEKMGGTTKDKGKFTNETHANTPEDCGAKCDSMDGCGSTVYCNFGGTIGTNCYLHGKKLVGSEELKQEVGARCFSYFKKCTLAGTEAKDGENGVASAPQKKVSPYESLGCWKDSIPRALTSIDVTVAQTHGHYKSRSHPLQNCLEAAKASGHTFFALQDGGQCFGSKDATAYKKYGDSTACSDGKGGPMANSVYGVRIGPICCKAMIAQCLSCTVGQTVSEYCVINPATVGCPARNDDVETTVVVELLPTVTETIPVKTATTKDDNDGECCRKIRVDSNGEAKTTHFWTLGTFIKTNTLSLKGVTFAQVRIPGNTEQYYLAGTENGGWKIGRLWNGNVESLVHYDAKINCPTDTPTTPWMVRNGDDSLPDTTLTIQCED